MRAIVKNISNKQEEYHSEYSVKFGELQLLLQCLDPEVSEENVIVSCVDELKHLISNRQLFIDKFEDIPNVAKNAQMGIIRLVNKFGRYNDILSYEHFCCFKFAVFYRYLRFSVAVDPVSVIVEYIKLN